MIESHLADLEKFLSFKAYPVKGEANTFELKISDITLTIKDLSPGFSIRSIICPLPTMLDEDLTIFLMKANFLGQGTGGAVLSIDPSEKYLTLSLSIQYDINYKTFKDKLEDFINYLEYWRKEILSRQIEDKIL